MTDISLFYLSIVLFAGLVFGRLVKLIKLPNVTGYLIAGLIVGPSCLKLLSADTISNFNIISDVALGFIAFSIGSQFKISYLKRVGATPIVIAALEGFLAMAIVTVSCLFLGYNVPFSLLLGAIGSATAPAATIMVIKQYNAKGPVTETLLSVVAMDDAVALIAFGFAMAITNSYINPENTSILDSIISPIYEIAGSVILGFILGLLFLIPLKYFKKDSNRLIITVAFIFFAVAAASWLNFSALLLTMCMGAVVINKSRDGEKIISLIDNITPPIFLLFFALSGAALDISILSKIGLVGVVYIFARMTGKMLGSYIGAKSMHAPKTVQKYLGPTLIPQAGVAIGLSLIAANTLPNLGPQIRAIVLCTTLIHELIGPGISKISLKKAGEIKEG